RGRCSLAAVSGCADRVGSVSLSSVANSAGSYHFVIPARQAKSVALFGLAVELTTHHHESRRPVMTSNLTRPLRSLAVASVIASVSLSIATAGASGQRHEFRIETATAAFAVQSTTPTGLPSFAEPAISPDRSEIAFVSGGDIWTVAASGGDARL